MKTQIFLNDYNWQEFSINDTTIFYKGFHNESKLLEITKSLIKKKTNLELSAFINKLENNFSIIMKRKNEIYAFSDKIKSFPMLYYKDKCRFLLFENFKLIKNCKLDFTIDKKQILYFSMSGYTISNNTIYKNIKPIKQGTFIHFFKNTVKEYEYFYFNNKKTKKDLNIKEKLKKINENIILKLIASCQDKQIVIPLPAGYDSRFILTGLKKYGYKNISTFSYGRKNNREEKIAKELTSFMKIPWIYIPYTNKKLQKIKNSKQHRDYEAYADNLTSIHFPQDFTAIKYLHDNNLISRDCVIVNGQLGDFISGNHLPNIKYIKKNATKDLIYQYIYKHLNLWNSYYLKNKNKIYYQILNIINKKKFKHEKESQFKIFENLEFENRQCKYVINGQRLYEFFNYEWRLPLWDSEYLNFWSSIPLELKLNQKLYKETLHETDWCGVWNNIPINPKNSFTLDIILLRYMFKAFFIFRGKERWHLFEKKYLNYFIEASCGFPHLNYFRVIKDDRVFRNSLSWETDKYLKEKKINWEKIIIDNKL